MSMDPDPARTPDLEPGGGVAPGRTPPETAQTSGLSAPEPRTSYAFPPTGIAAIAVIMVLVAVFVIVAVSLLL
ncbi:DUF6480 family protein [Nocardia stercoris]|uniref:Uncharacterized protein n=1 Tax=Nocardia stercoris TaxID=2483361 RepID=A0A3M2L0D4_9NOCA|nr:DUF6480 family protein [Nocardia stercoris]RMI30396.1 hypothetical protein EBN03_22435 [Nocardia stercoris]